MKFKKEGKAHSKILIAIFLAATIILSGCSNPVTPGNNNNVVYNQAGLLENSKVETKTFKSEEEYRNFIADYASGSNGYYGGIFRSSSKSIGLEAMDSASPTSAGGSPDFSGTNNQVANVDEADMLKTDGEYIYTITDNTVFIIKSYPGVEAKVVSTIKFDNTPQSLFINGNKLAVIGYISNFNFLSDIGFARNQGYTFLNIYDISNKESAKLVKEFKFEGDYNNARLVGNEIYLVSTFYPTYDDHPIPLMFEGNVRTEMPIDKIHYFNIPYRNPYLVTVNSVNMQTLESDDSEAITVEGYPQIYMSEDNLYVVYTQYINEYELEQDIMLEVIMPKLSDEDKAYIAKVENTDSDILSRYEKKAKILSVVSRYFSSLPENERDALQDEIDSKLKAKLEEYKYFEYTIINKLNIASGKITVDSNGKVPGHISNQFSMDEYKNNFRIATTISQRWNRFGDMPVATAAVDVEVGSVASKIAIMPRDTSSKSQNNLYIMNSDLKIIGSIEGLAEGEQIYSVRFMGERAYMVTFRQVDPFFALDLSNPSSPKVLGELKIPGFSRYLHPYDENTIIGIGQDATELGRTQGLKISLFDVTDVANPKEIAKYVAGEKYSSSSAEYEHKAFLFSKEKELLVIPVYSYDYENKGNDMNGAFVFKITKDEIALRGLIDHSSQQRWGPNVERSLYIEDLLYTKSPYMLRINELDDLSSVKNITLSSSNLKVNVY
jgi:inhibitor of cysteine peptidase